LEGGYFRGAIDYIFVFGLLYLSGILLGFNFGLEFGVWVMWVGEIHKAI
jgi:hypothetical protein